MTTEIARSILPISGTMIGICTTLIGLVKINESIRDQTQVDEYGALVAVAFLASAALSYVAIRLAKVRPSLARRLERVADAFFLAGLLSLVILAGGFAFEVV
ncbi:hypothetical protein EK403_08270 [Hansschlegelia zhihuaiae]|uniref:Uncharacterized protein n=1 Tax=Hansschlegelia zhihuaiae TaxID=405005 RepID=A0A4Q0MKA3_9HYPH|nr:hypothetical protein EK403_08270 [Hansschlegelia zhihuaiae]